VNYRDPYNPETIVTVCSHCHWAYHRPMEAFLATRWGQIAAAVILLLTIFLVFLFSTK
jgi:hypothetical protein